MLHNPLIGTLVAGIFLSGPAMAQTNAEQPEANQSAQATTQTIRERPFNPFFETPGSGDLRITVPTGPYRSPDRSVGGLNEFNFDAFLAPSARGQQRSLRQRLFTQP
ncbi:MAG: hypothetical protein AAF367_13640 [Pseudomonadota bacterium]